jgi:hypothetical protein
MDYGDEERKDCRLVLEVLAKPKINIPTGLIDIVAENYQNIPS